MVCDLCRPQFQTSISCNKLCADAHDASNLVSGEAAARQRGLRLEYFLRPPLHVTLRFRWRVQLCRVDVELWPRRAESDGSGRRLELLTAGEEEGARFQLVCRCDLRERARACFLRAGFRPLPPFSEPPPPPSADAERCELWSRGPLSLSSVTQLRVSVPFSGADSALGIKALAVWAVPAPCCSPAERRSFLEAHAAGLKAERVASTPQSSAPPLDPVPPDSALPEEFLDPLTQELMLLPMILPSGSVVDSRTLDEYQRREATWGRSPNDPFTGVPFTPSSKPLPDPHLKSRIDRLLLLRAGRRSVQPRPSRLLPPLTSPPQPDPVARPAKRPRDTPAGPEEGEAASRLADRVPVGGDSHERRLALSLDHALNAVLQGRPAFASPPQDAPDTGTAPLPSPGRPACVFCRGEPSVCYSLSCGHVTCRACLRLQVSRASTVTCASCHAPTSSADITRLHHTTLAHTHTSPC